MRSEARLYQFDREEFSAARLTPELAQTNPDLYKTRLVQLLKAETSVAGQVWDRLCERDNIDLEGIQIEANTWTGFHEGSKIVIGAQPWEESFRRAAFFEGDRFTDEKEKILILSHELSHRVLSLVQDEEIDNFSRFLIGIRRDTGNGFSSLGSLPFYESKGPSIQGIEDFTELVNKYLIDPDCLNRFLTLLANPDKQPERDQLKLTTIPSEYIKPITGIVERAIVLV